TGTPLWDVLGRVVDRHYPGAKLLPRLIVGFTDAPYFREHGAVAYGFGLFSSALTAEAMSGRFHGNDERIDVESLSLTTQAWHDTGEVLLGGEAAGVRRGSRRVGAGPLSVGVCSPVTPPG